MNQPNPEEVPAHKCPVCHGYCDELLPYMKAYAVVHAALCDIRDKYLPLHPLHHQNAEYIAKMALEQVKDSLFIERPDSHVTMSLAEARQILTDRKRLEKAVAILQEIYGLICTDCGGRFESKYHGIAQKIRDILDTKPSAINGEG